MEKTKQTEIFKKVIPLILGVILIGAGIFTFFRSSELVKVCTEKVTATVVNMREDFTSDPDSEGGMRYTYYPIIEYQANGNTVKAELSSGSNPPAYSVNDKIDILYNPNKTDEFIVAGENQNIVWIILVSLGAASLLASLYFLIKK